jgi:hypothetical protein
LKLQGEKTMELETATKNTLGAARSNAKTFVKGVALLVIVLSTFALSPAKPSRAQLDPIGGYEILQKGIKVGEIYVPKRDLGAIKYVEHWVLFANYVYPGRNADLLTTIGIGPNSYESEADFFARVSWGPGFRYVRVDCTDTDRLPGR